MLAYGFADTLPAAVACKRAYEAAGRALALNPQLSLGYSVLALLQMLDGQHEEAVASARKAVALGPNSAEAYLNLAVVLIYAGLHEDALQAIETVLRLNPKPSRQVREYHAFVLYMNSARTRSRRSARDRTWPWATSAWKRSPGSTHAWGDWTRRKVPSRHCSSVSPKCALPGFASPSRIMPESRTERPAEALRLAGLSEWPYGIEGDPAHQLKGEAIDALTFGHAWEGERVGSGPFMQYVEADGAFIERGPTMQVTGAASRQGDRGLIPGTPPGTPAVRSDLPQPDGYAGQAGRVHLPERLRGQAVFRHQ